MSTPSELVIVHSGEGTLEDLVLYDDRIRYVHIPGSPTLGEKHNAAVEIAKYDWIAKWDDDDWQSPSRLQTTLDVALDTKSRMVSAAPLLHHDLETDQCWEYRYLLERPWQPGNSLLIHRSLWAEIRFDHGRDRGIDTDFIFRALDSGEIGITIDNAPLTVVLHHGQDTGLREWPPTDKGFVEVHQGANWVMGTDLQIWLEAYQCRG